MAFVAYEYDVQSNEYRSRVPINITVSSKNTEKTGTVKDLALGSIPPGACNYCFQTTNTGCVGTFGKAKFEGVIINPALLQAGIMKILKDKNGICPSCLLLRNLGPISIVMEKKGNSSKEILYEAIRLANKQSQTKCPNCSTRSTAVIKGDNIFCVEKTKDQSKEIEHERLFTAFSNIDPRIFGALGYSENFLGVFFNGFILIPPNNVRDSGIDEKNEHQLTKKYEEIFKQTTNNNNTNNKFQLLYKAVISTFEKEKKDGKNNNWNQSTKPDENLAQRADMNNRETGEVYRGILSRRYPRTTRAPITHGTYINIGEIGVPEFMFKNNVTMAPVTFFNRRKIQKLIDENKVKSIIKRNPNDSVSEFKTKINSTLINRSVNPGDWVCIDMVDYQVVVFVRTPVLHRHNFQAMKIIKEHFSSDKYSISISSSQAHSYNADFDGDEGTIENNQVFAGHASTLSTINCYANLFNDTNGNIMFGATQEQIIILCTIYLFKNIDREIIINILGKYNHLIRDPEKQSYNGDEFLSLLLPRGLTIPNICENGNFTAKILTISSFAALSSSPLAKNIGKIFDEIVACNFIDTLKYISQRCLEHFGIGLKTSDLELYPGFFEEMEVFVEKIIKEENLKIEKYIEDVRARKVAPMNKSELDNFYLQKGIDVIEKCNEKILKALEITPDSNTLKLLYNIKYKVSLKALCQLWGVQGQLLDSQSQIPQNSVNGRLTIHSKSNSYSLADRAFIGSSFISGFNLSDMALQQAFRVIPTLIDQKEKAGVTGAGSRTLSIAISDVLNNNLGFLTYDTFIISLAAYGLKIEGKDICKVPIIPPEKGCRWEQYLFQLWKELKPNLVFNNRTRTMVYINFWVELHTEIPTFINRMEKKGTLLGDEEVFSKVKGFLEKDVAEAFFCDLLYLPPLEYIFLVYLSNRKINIYSELLDYLFQKIVFQLVTSLSPNTPIGFMVANNIAEDFTQSALNIFHTSSKVGYVIKSKDYKSWQTNLKINDKSSNFLVKCTGQNKEDIENIVQKFKHVVLKDLLPEISFQDIDKEVTKITITIFKKNMESENLSIFDLYELIWNFSLKLETDKFIILVDSPSDQTITYSLIFENQVSNYKINERVQLFIEDAIGKGIFGNKNIPILKTVYNDPETLETKEAYSVNIELKDYGELVYFRSNRGNVILEVPSQILFKMRGIEACKIVLGQKLESTFANNEDCPLHLGTEIIASVMCRMSRPVDLKDVGSNRYVVRAIHGYSQAIRESAIKNVKDPMRSIFSCIIGGVIPRCGINAHRMFIDPDIYSRLKVKKKKDIVIMDQEIEEEI